MPDITFRAPHGEVPGYLAVPAEGAGPWPGVVVIHEAFGLNADIRGKADQMAAHGYVALAPDLFERRAWILCVRNAFTQIRAQSGPAFETLDAARSFVAGRADCTGHTGVIGFCMGGGFALLCATRNGFSAAGRQSRPSPRPGATRQAPSAGGSDRVEVDALGGDPAGQDAQDRGHHRARAADEHLPVLAGGLLADHVGQQAGHAGPVRVVG